MRAQSHRTERVAALVRSAISNALLHGTHDKVLQSTIVTEVVMTKDLRTARIYFTTPVVDKDFRLALQAAMFSLRKHVAEEVQLKFVPELKFFRDTHTEEVQRVYQLLEEVHAKDSNRNEV